MNIHFLVLGHWLQESDPKIYESSEVFIPLQVGISFIAFLFLLGKLLQFPQIFFPVMFVYQILISVLTCILK